MKVPFNITNEDLIDRIEDHYIDKNMLLNRALALCGNDLFYIGEGKAMFLLNSPFSIVFDTNGKFTVYHKKADYQSGIDCMISYIKRSYGLRMKAAEVLDNELVPDSIKKIIAINPVSFY